MNKGHKTQQANIDYVINLIKTRQVKVRGQWHLLQTHYKHKK